jgi:superfamily II helicase
VPFRGWTVVYQGSRFQADVLAAVLEAHGIRVEVFGDTAYGMGIDFTDARALVPDEQASAARRLIKEAEKASPEPEPESEL